MCRRFFFLIILVLFGLAVAAWWCMRNTAPAHVFVNPKDISPREARAAQTRLEDALRRPPTPAGPTTTVRLADRGGEVATGRPVAVHLSQNDINTALATNPGVKKQMEARGIQAAELAFTPPNIVAVYSKVLYHGSPVDAQITGTVSPGAAGGVQFTAQRASVDDIPVPVAKVQRAIDTIVAEWLPKANSALPISVQQVAIQGKEITLTGPAKSPPAK